MHFLSGVLRRAVAIALSCLPLASQGASSSVPEVLKPWEGWVLWGQEDATCPTPYDDASKHVCFWPSRLQLTVEAKLGRFEFGVTVFKDSWVPLPGGQGIWPQTVQVDGREAAVLEREGRPAVWLGAGTHQVTGQYTWDQIPQSLAVPREIGLLALTLEGQPVEGPAWSGDGLVWLKRERISEEADRDFLATKVYALLEDGIPLWLQTEIELIVSGKSREEDLGSVLPEGWKLAAVQSSIPVAVDEVGRMKAQVRPGKWTVRLSAFRLDNPVEFAYPAGAKPAVDEELIAFRAAPEFRMVEISGTPSIDVSQTPFPEKWRNLPVYRWDTTLPFRWEERLRGAGMQKPQGLQISRTWWLDEDGKAFTFRDQISGLQQQIWRLDAAAGQDLGSVRSGGQGQLITRNPQNDAPGVEIRTRNLNLEATGRMARSHALPAAGWRADADALNVEVNLPPGWRLFALFGADWVRGDWLTAWTLLDLFLLLIFTLAVFRLWGPLPAVLAFLAFGLSYHELGAPRYSWLLVLVPVALLRVVPVGTGTRLLKIWRALAIAVLVFVLVPFLSQQVQQALFPQLETVQGSLASSRQNYSMGVVSEVASSKMDSVSAAARAAAPIPQSLNRRDRTENNLAYDPKARIQTGPGLPDWTWRSVTFGWNGPVQETQNVRPVLISATLERILTVLRIGLLLALAGLLVGVPWRLLRRRSAAVLAGLVLLAPADLRAQFPDESMLETLKQRLLAPSEAYPNAAAVPWVSLSLQGRRVVIEAEVHAGVQTAVPVPGRLAAWSPLSVTVDGQPEAALRRDDGDLWVVVPPGVHRVRVEGLLAEVTEWEWTFRLKPHQVKIDAPGWKVSGVSPNGVPEPQVFFTFEEKSTGGAATYERQDVQAVAEVERTIELGLVWQVRTTVRRLSPAGRALALPIPLLSGENVLSSNVVVKDGAVEVRLGAQDEAFSWESELSVKDALELATKATDTWVERWKLIVSPVWNVALNGLPPVFAATTAELIPEWHPWPGESVTLAISRPEAVAGATITVDKATQTVSLGKRQRTSRLELSLRCSLGEDFAIELPPGAEVTSLHHDGVELPARVDQGKLVIPLRPGPQTIALSWTTDVALGFQAKVEPVRLPVESANILTVVEVPESRWILWTDGPQQGPAVRFWTVLICALLAAVILGRLPLSPLRTVEWMLLGLGLTQVPLAAAVLVVGWLFVLAWRGRADVPASYRWRFNLLQVVVIGLTLIALGILVAVVAEGLLGNPEMFIQGNDSSCLVLNWYQASSLGPLPQPACFSVSIWWYRILMLLWALWLAASLIRWLRWGWEQFSASGCFRIGQKKA